MSSNTPAGTSSTQQESDTNSTGPNVAECVYEFLLAEVLHWIDQRAVTAVKSNNDGTNGMHSHVITVRSSNDNNDAINASNKSSISNLEETDGNMTGVSADWGTASVPAQSATTDAAVPNNKHENDVADNNDNTGATAAKASTATEKERELAFERAAAKIESMGYNVGYRLCERLAQTKPSLSMAVYNNHDDSALEAVKFLCKEFWTEVFRKQIDKLQTNHRGVFVLKDHELLWLRRLPADDERSRVAAIKLLAFPCGLIRGALSNLGISTVVSCDFLADGKNMASCSFNIKVKA